MLRIARALLTCSLIVPAAAAQGAGHRFAAVLAGATLSDLDGLAATSDSRWGATAGIAVGYNSWRTALALEGNWVQKGGEGIRLDYVEVPLTVESGRRHGSGFDAGPDLQRGQRRIQGRLQSDTPSRCRTPLKGPTSRTAPGNSA